ncbi:PE-PGRS family protein [Streptantibioticus ferralitis]|uniref:PE-PGRS family protein n=1 Tax=Streptantibioticus ferralitis TaxID=236510 RepID=A0ABT5YWH0_9ACTN|nr:PE-PGRS family protein [Streptantibioticus ferralitis]MDF2255910.1 PE-PGRS family protein [Streptantibioticus ferralitis]
MTTGPIARTVRAAVFAAVCVVTTALGHALMSGDTVPWWALTAAFCGTGAAAWSLAARERGALVVTGATVVAQLGLHSLFSLAQASAGMGGSPERQWAATLLCDATGTSRAHMSQAAAVQLLRQSGLSSAAAHRPPPTTMGSMPGMADMPGMDMGHVDGVSGALSQLPMTHSGHGGLGMFLAHLLAALVCGLWLWRGEAAAFRIGRSLAAALFTPLLLVLTTLGWTGGPRPPAGVVAIAPVRCLRGVLLQYAVSRRGPPGLQLCC